MINLIKIFPIFIVTFSTTRCSASLNTCDYSQTTQLSALTSRVSNLEYNNAALEESIESKIASMETSIEKFLSENDKSNSDNIPFDRLDYWTKIDSDISDHLYYRVMPVTKDLGAALVSCKEFRKDSNMGQVLSYNELYDLKKFKKEVLLAAYNGKPSANQKLDYTWIYDGSSVDPSLMHADDGQRTTERCIFLNEKNGEYLLGDTRCDVGTGTGWTIPFLCELRA